MAVLGGMKKRAAFQGFAGSVSFGVDSADCRGLQCLQRLDGGDEQRGIRPVQGGDHWATTDHEPLISSRSRRAGETGDGQPGSQMEWQMYKLQVASGTVAEPAEQQSFQHWVASRVHRVLLNGFFHTTKARLVPFQSTGHRAQGTGHPPTTPKNPFFLRAHMLWQTPAPARGMDGTACLQAQPTPPN